MTVNEFEREIENVKEYEVNIMNLRSFLYDLEHLGTSQIGRVSFFSEEDRDTTTITLDFPKKNISKMTAKYLEELKNEYEEAIKKLNQCGLNIEADKDIIGE